MFSVFNLNPCLVLLWHSDRLISTLKDDFNHFLKDCLDSFCLNWGWCRMLEVCWCITAIVAKKSMQNWTHGQLYGGEQSHIDRKACAAN